MAVRLSIKCCSLSSTCRLCLPQLSLRTNCDAAISSSGCASTRHTATPLCTGHTVVTSLAAGKPLGYWPKSYASIRATDVLAYTYQSFITSQVMMVIITIILNMVAAYKLWYCNVFVAASKVL